MSFPAERLGGNYGSRMSAVRLGIGGLVGPHSLLVLRLDLGRSRVLVAIGNPFLRRGDVLNPAWPAVIGNAAAGADGVSLDNCPVVVSGVDDALIHTHDRGVVGKFIAAPFSPGKTDAAIPVAVVHSAVVADVPAPVAAVEPVATTKPPPIGRRPQGSFIGSRNPCAGNPVVVVVAIGPVAGCPNQVGLGTEGLFVDRQFGWSETDTDRDLCMRKSWKE